MTTGETRDNPLVVGNFEISVALSQQRTIKMAGYCYSTDTSNDINSRVDQMQDALDRQVIRVDLVAKRALIEQHMLNLQMFKHGYQDLVEKGKTPGKKLTSQDKQAMDNYEPGVRRATEAIESLRAAIAEGEKKLALN